MSIQISSYTEKDRLLLLELAVRFILQRVIVVGEFRHNSRKSAGRNIDRRTDTRNNKGKR